MTVSWRKERLSVTSERLRDAGAVTFHGVGLDCEHTDEAGGQGSA